MSNKQRLKRIPADTIDEITLSFWHDLSKDHRMIKLLNFCEQTQKGKYSEDHPESVHSHVQTERNGATKGWNRLVSLLLNPPSMSDSVTEKKKFKQEEMKFADSQI